MRFQDPDPAATRVAMRLPQVPRVYKVSDTLDLPWVAYIPPRGPQDYENPDDLDSAILGPYGGTYWPSQQDACDFLRYVMEGPPEGAVASSDADPLRPSTWFTQGAPVELQLLARIIVKVGGDRVTNVVILPAVGATDPPDPFHVWDAHGASDERIAEAIEIADTTTWAPLEHLPDGLSWES